MEIQSLIASQDEYFRQFDNANLPRGGLSVHDINELHAWVKKYATQNVRIADVGVWTGQSTCILANIAKELNGKVFSVDWFNGSDETNLQWAGSYFNIRKIFESNIKKHDLRKHVEIVEMKSHEAPAKFEDNYFDFVFLDADHRYDFIKRDIEMWLPKVKIGGYLMGHDCEVVIDNGIESLMKIFREKDTITMLHLGVCLAVGELGGQKCKGIDVFPPEHTLENCIWYYKKS